MPEVPRLLVERWIATVALDESNFWKRSDSLPEKIPEKLLAFRDFFETKPGDFTGD